ncbi:hypothetical protein AB0H43_36410 [Hamadaea sp. NPDC050747]|uniref:hypothetical protein n=1 Tax=Hamadaea sp. NPDC050747 TaxID=3155789 RepID=UPI0033D80955
MTSTDPRPARPATVTTAVVLALIVAAINLLSVLLGWIRLGGQLDAIDELISSRGHGSSVGLDSDAEALTSGYVIGVVFASFVLLALTVSYLINGMLAAVGKQVSRVLLWVTAALDLCYFGCSTVLAGAPTDAELSNGGTISSAELGDAIAESEPGWLSLIQIPATVLWAGCLLALIATLAAPSANRYFRPASPQPPMMPPAVR